MLFNFKDLQKLLKLYINYSKLSYNSSKFSNFVNDSFSKERELFIKFPLKFIEINVKAKCYYKALNNKDAPLSVI